MLCTVMENHIQICRFTPNTFKAKELATFMIIKQFEPLHIKHAPTASKLEGITIASGQADVTVKGSMVVREDTIHTLNESKGFLIL